MNAITVHDIKQVFAGKSVFSTIDLVSAYHQIPLTPEDREKTPLITPFGLLEFNVITFGLRNASQTFQRHMNNILSDPDFEAVYIDDICVAWASEV